MFRSWRPGTLDLTKLERTVIADGEFCVIECAVRSDGSTPVEVLLRELEEGTWPNPNSEELPDSYQPRQRDRFLALCELLAEGDDLPQNAVNHLEDGIWEFKVGDLRVTFYDTDGRGGYVAKTPKYVSNWSGADFEYDMDEFVRLGHYFAKTGPTTTSNDLQSANEVRVEDLTHDRT